MYRHRHQRPTLDLCVALRDGAVCPQHAFLRTTLLFAFDHDARASKLELKITSFGASYAVPPGETLTHTSVWAGTPSCHEDGYLLGLTSLLRLTKMLASATPPMPLVAGANLQALTNQSRDSPTRDPPTRSDVSTTGAMEPNASPVKSAVDDRWLDSSDAAVSEAAGSDAAVSDAAGFKGSSKHPKQPMHPSGAMAPPSGRSAYGRLHVAVEGAKWVHGAWRYTIGFGWGDNSCQLAKRYSECRGEHPCTPRAAPLHTMRDAHLPRLKPKTLTLRALNPGACVWRAQLCTKR
jgi:hypothetical protein